MEVKLFWSFDSRMNLYGATEYMYDLYRASMLRAKNLGYEINFYGDDVAINKFQGYVDNFYDIIVYLNEPKNFMRVVRCSRKLCLLYVGPEGLCTVQKLQRHPTGLTRY